MNNPISGFQYFIAGFSLITKPGLKRFIIIPLIINLILFIGLFFLLRHYMHVLNAWVAGQLPDWLHWLAIILWIFFFIGFFLVFIYTFVAVANLISAPFNSLLSEKVELYLTGNIRPGGGLLENVKDVPRVIGRQLTILGYYLPRALLILILFFIPVVHFFASILWFLFSAWFMAMTFIDYPSDNHRVAIPEVHIWLKDKRWVVLGFGVSTLFATMIPIVNCFAIPAAVAAATKLWLEEK